ncbi:sulfatase-like hydrolase/transferase [Chelativorans sp. AA-79]|uniref:sulfatase-like hydrolase/transferase n=1 Tax=Chelativorans sp. AA-79 TaxID=3028735 RepID=UPI0023F9E42B|nr:sulfatase-like hydrolase/transferase [Chelativorans sp. AA-79]WEX08831.1 sulfatase-like hydrolase/transferase [Chelativorans sp. AA-79]
MAEEQESSPEAVGSSPTSRATRVWDGSYPLHPFLFAIASVLVMMARNLDQTSIADVAPSLAGALLFALTVYLAVVAIRRRFDRVSAVIASIWVIGCLFYAGLFDRLNGLVDGGYSMTRTLPLALAALAAATLLAVLLRRAAAVIHSVLTGIAAVLLISPIWQAASYEWQNGAARNVYEPEKAMAEIEPFIAPAKANGSSRPPDIYHFIFDRYASEGVLRDHFDVDNGSIGSFLEERGFYIARDSNSNYQKTGPSLASTFYMDYLDLLADDPRVQGSNWHPIYAMLDDHRVARFLKSRGYDFIQFGSWWVGTYDNPTADENRPHGFSEFEMLYLRRTALRPLFHVLPDRPLTMRLDWDNAQCQRIAPQVEEIKALGQRDKPVYVFAHILVPHGPFNFTNDGRCLTIEESRKRGEDQGYLEQIAYANRIIEEVVIALQSPDREPPIILIQADEGPFPERDGRVPWQDAPPNELRVKSGILNAYYFPNGDYSALRPDITPVNSYRVLFNTYFGTDFPILPDRIFFFPYDSRLYEYHDVTDKVRGPDIATRPVENLPQHP